jgi:hypothetical protein
VADGWAVHSRRERGTVWEWDRIEFGPLKGLGGNRDDASKWPGSSDGPHGGLSCPEKTVGTTYSLGGGFLRTLREWISGFHDRLRVKRIRIKIVLNKLALTSLDCFACDRFCFGPYTRKFSGYFRVRKCIFNKIDVQSTDL